MFANRSRAMPCFQVALNAQMGEVRALLGKVLCALFQRPLATRGLGLN